MATLFQLLPSLWQEKLTEVEPLIDEIEKSLESNSNYLPERKFIFRALNSAVPPKVIVIGQDPYPDPLNAMGLAFSVSAQQKKLPASLRNIFVELQADLEYPLRTNGDLTDWHEQGVVLLNRTLTVSVGETNSHSKIGWHKVTERIVKILTEENSVVGVLWGKPAQELKPYFKSENVIESAHPSPLAAYRGFFGSRPFSRVNSKLIELGKVPINWG